MPNMITLRELLEDEWYKKYFLAIPKLPPHIRKASLPWKLMVLREGETQWRTRRFGTYREAFMALKKVLPHVKDAVINCPGYDWQPPMRQVRVKNKFDIVRGKKVPMIRTIVWKPQLDGDMPIHYWCPYCRRPTVFSYFEWHPAMTKQRTGGVGPMVDPTLLRCGICGASESLVNLRHPATHQGWDTNRMKVA